MINNVKPNFFDKPKRSQSNFLPYVSCKLIAKVSICEFIIIDGNIVDQGVRKIITSCVTK